MILYPQYPLNDKQADIPFQPEYLNALKAGFKCSLFDLEWVFNPKPKIDKGETVLYRGWMLNEEKYTELTKLVTIAGGVMAISVKEYMKCHHIVNWYHSVDKYSPKTVFLPYDGNLIRIVDMLNWTGGYFVKDFVKSNTTGFGSICDNGLECQYVADLIHLHRGGIEGGIAIRKVLKLLQDSEQRFFVVNGKAYYGNQVVNDKIIEIAEHAAANVKSPFFSVDIAQTLDGEFHLIEIGDGQVSEATGWKIEDFVELLEEVS